MHLPKHILPFFFPENMAGYTITQVACGWAGVVIKKEPRIWAGNAKPGCKHQKRQVRPTDRPNRIRLACTRLNTSLSTNETARLSFSFAFGFIVGSCSARLPPIGPLVHTLNSIVSWSVGHRSPNAPLCILVPFPSAACFFLTVKSQSISNC